MTFNGLAQRGLHYVWMAAIVYLHELIFHDGSFVAFFFLLLFL